MPGVSTDWALSVAAAPLSYASPLLLSHLSLERGIASVSSATESMGGHILAEHDRGRHRNADDYSVSGKAQAGFNTNGNLSSTAVQLVGANDTHKFALLTQLDEGKDLKTPRGDLLPTRLDRARYDLSYSFAGDSTTALFYAGRLTTADTGTPSLPMDIRSIDTDMIGLDMTTTLGENSTLRVMLADTAVDHVMDNFGIRPPPAGPMAYRSTHATGSGTRWRIGSTTESTHGSWQFGFDGESVNHDATISNPNMAPFRIENFDNATRDISGLFAQWNREQGSFDLEAGLRFNRVNTNADPIAATIPAMNPMMQMMGMMANQLAMSFNAADRSSTHNNVDVVLKLGRVLGSTRNIYVEVARKTRAPSYQELFLWLPMQATGGLADGRTYIGDPSLRSEVSREIKFGSNWQSTKAWIAPQLFFKNINNYIQGVPSSNTTANALATMMSGTTALQFTNTDAEIYGLDLAWGYYLSDQLTLTGVLTYARGKRTDVADNLYRLAPLNGTVALTWQAEKWLARIEAVAAAAQHKVARYNTEPRTPGYGVLNATAQWRTSDRLTVSATATNLFDKAYADHLDGINRVFNAPIAAGQRLPGLGRALQVGVRYAW